jgi:hypothetical protein
MADDNTTGKSREAGGRKFPVIALVLVALLFIALFAVIFFYGQFAAWPGAGESDGVGP